MERRNRVAAAFAPATVANVAVGFDVLGFAVDAVGDTVRAELLDEPTVIIDSVEGGPAGGKALPLDAAGNTAGVALLSLIRAEGLGFGFRLRVRKGIPLSSGMGGSAASAVAALSAANALLDRPLPPARLLSHALAGEELASGARHGDNAAPCLYGGLVILRSAEGADVVRLPVPEGLCVALAHPHRELDTRTSRGVLPAELPLRDYVRQSARLASFVAACCLGDYGLMARSLEDVLIEPRRAGLIPAFGDVKRAALEAGALGCSISGSGPSVFALCRGPEAAGRAAAAMGAAWAAAGVESDAWSCPLSAAGARQAAWESGVSA